MEIRIKRIEYEIKISTTEFEENVSNQAPNSAFKQTIAELLQLTNWDIDTPDFIRLLYRCLNAWNKYLIF